jgi:hypothetical protein
LRAKKVEKLCNSHKTASKQMMLTGNFENEIPESDSGTIISGFADS